MKFRIGNVPIPKTAAAIDSVPAPAASPTIAPMATQTTPAKLGGSVFKPAPNPVTQTAVPTQNPAPTPAIAQVPVNTGKEVAASLGFTKVADYASAIQAHNWRMKQNPSENRAYNRFMQYEQGKPETWLTSLGNAPRNLWNRAVGDDAEFIRAQEDPKYQEYLAEEKVKAEGLKAKATAREAIATNRAEGNKFYDAVWNAKGIDRDQPLTEMYDSGLAGDPGAQAAIRRYEGEGGKAPAGYQLGAYNQRQGNSGVRGIGGGDTSWAQAPTSNWTSTGFSQGNDLAPNAAQNALARGANSSGQVGALGTGGVPGGHYSAAEWAGMQNKEIANALAGVKSNKPRSKWDTSPKPEGADATDEGDSAQNTGAPTLEAPTLTAAEQAQGSVLGPNAQPVAADSGLTPMFAGSRPMFGSTPVPQPTDQLPGTTSPSEVPAINNGGSFGATRINNAAQDNAFSGPGWSGGEAQAPAVSAPMTQSSIVSYSPGQQLPLSAPAIRPGNTPIPTASSFNAGRNALGVLPGNPGGLVNGQMVDSQPRPVAKPVAAPAVTKQPLTKPKVLI